MSKTARRWVCRNNHREGRVVEIAGLHAPIMDSNGNWGGYDVVFSIYCSAERYKAATGMLLAPGEGPIELFVTMENGKRQENRSILDEPAFPHNGWEHKGISLRVEAAIRLRVPCSGIPELDDMIRQSLGLVPEGAEQETNDAV